MIPIKSSEITPENVYLNRRTFMKGVGLAALGGLAVAACAPAATPIAEPAASTAGTAAPVATASTGATTDELGDPVNSYEQITNYNNFYEFTTDKEKVAGLAKDFPTRPWTVEVGGLVNNPGTFSIEDILSTFEREERVYRLRCVEGWSMVIPWLGFQLSKLLEKADPQSSAKYVRFETLMDPDKMPGERSSWFEWPYVEGLRIDEAMNPLALIATGLYGKELLPQNGAPLRLVVPWKYGFKSIKSIVKIDLVEEQPTSLWMAAAPNEYGFYANVNPEVQHPRWSQRTERRIGETKRRETLMFNGYGDEVAHLYDGMNLAAYY
ncbi:MAG: protein-methionine-sulfoxide reductase catalytic subunit MsrP [Caldilineae bacterium]|nr:protein-methionine-sulfoxide reductase catalytic subunit MsrP [Anaerolineae bacterium]MCB9154439.1 protein-methionine-sulfoxide reductase catalytic subunit MsrP [Caldilineae bacterium]